MSLNPRSFYYGHDHEMNDVRDFHEKLGLLAPDVMNGPGHVSQEWLDGRIKFLEEELAELKEARDNNDLVKQADALFDIVYVAKGTAVGLNLPWKAVWREGQRSNIEKEQAGKDDGYKRGVVKPPGWREPDFASVLHAAGYRREHWFIGNQVNQELCYDRK